MESEEVINSTAPVKQRKQEFWEAIVTRAPNDNFRKTSVRKTIWDVEFSDYLL